MRHSDHGAFEGTQAHFKGLGTGQIKVVGGLVEQDDRRLQHQCAEPLCRSRCLRKSTTHNLEVTSWLALFHGLGCPVLFGASRKSSIGQMSRREPVGERLPGSLALGLAAAARGAQILRVHDVAETMQALSVQRPLDAVDR